MVLRPRRLFGAIGYATSLDGVNWIKWGPGLPVPVLEHGPAGSADSFSAADPTVLRDGSTWKMWYTGDDSSKKRIAYATSLDGVTWAKGGKVIAPEDPGVSANIEFGAFAPTVWKTPTGYAMLLTGRKLVGGGVFQTKVMGSSSADGVSWSGRVPPNPSGSNTNFDYSNLNSPELLQDPGAPLPTSSTTPETRSTPTTTSTRGSVSRRRTTAARSTRSTARRPVTPSWTSAHSERTLTRAKHQGFRWQRLGCHRETRRLLLGDARK